MCQDTHQLDNVMETMGKAFKDKVTGIDMVSTYLELKLADRKFNPVLGSPPRLLGSSQLDFQTITGLKRLITKDEVYEVPLLEAIRQILKFPEVREDLLKQKLYTASVSDISDSVMWTLHPLDAANPIRLGIYFDAIEYVEAIGVFRSIKKAVHIYITILNLSAQIRQKKTYMILAGSVFDKVMKKYGVADVISGRKAETCRDIKKPSTVCRGFCAKPPKLDGCSGIDLNEWLSDSSIGSFFRENWEAKNDFDLPYNPSTGLGPGLRSVVLQVCTLEID
jgi:endogenous inhibitor of DNA gyrase (YacG/DUF329 family)